MKLMISALLMLSACTSMEHAKQLPTQTSQVQSGQVAKPLIWRAHGTEPFWGFTVDREHVRFESMGEAPKYFPYSVFASVGDVRLFTASSGTGAATSTSTSTIAIRLRPQTCSDGMSDNLYPWHAEVQIDGKLLQGCARRGDQTE